MRQIRISKHSLLIEAKRAKIKAKYGKEICGLLVNYSSHVYLFNVHNSSKKPGQFRITREWYRIGLNKCGHYANSVIGLYHSHPYYYANPGKDDLESAVENEYMLIISPSYHKIKLWKIKNKSIAEQSWLPSLL